MLLLLRLLEKKTQKTRDHTLGREDGVGADRVGERLLSHSLGRGPECWGKVKEIYSSPVGRAENAKGSMEAVLCALPGCQHCPCGFRNSVAWLFNKVGALGDLGTCLSCSTRHSWQLGWCLEQSRLSSINVDYINNLSEGSGRYGHHKIYHPIWDTSRAKKNAISNYT